VDKGRFLIETHLRTGRPISELARTYGMDRSWLYRRLARYRREGEAGLEARSRRPHTSSRRIADLYEEEIVRLRKELSEAGFDAGAATIHYHLSKRHIFVPSVPTIWRVLNRRGFVTPQPQKRPKSSYVRFEADLPNERWQMDVTHVEMRGGHMAEVLNVIDDHSRLCVASRAFSVISAPDVVEVFAYAANRYGLPATVLSDNGAIFTASYRSGRCLTEIVFEAHGIDFRHSRPYHPQTCGKVERFHQTVKKYLVAHRLPRSLPELQARLDAFTDYYNEVRPHRAKGRRTPAEAYAARIKATPPGGPRSVYLHYRIRNDRVDANGTITVRHEGTLKHLGVGRRHKGERVLALVADCDVRVLSARGELLGHYVIDPVSDYQAKLPE
jgi:transposase InsO family protein